MNKRILIIVAASLLILPACSKKKAANAVIDSFSPGIPVIAPPPVTPAPLPDGSDTQAAEGKLNGNSFKPVAGAIFNKMFNELEAEIILTDESMDDCWPHHDRYVSIPLGSVDHILGDYTVNSSDWTPVLFYDYANGANMNFLEVKNNGMSWSVKEEPGVGGVGYFNIPANDANDGNYIVGKMTLKNCLK